MTSVEDAKLLVQYGQHNRRMGSTLLNQSSSRSHCIFTIKLIRLMDTNRPKQAIINRCEREGGRGCIRSLFMYVCAYVCMYVCMNVCMYVQLRGYILVWGEYTCEYRWVCSLGVCLYCRCVG